MKKNTRNKTHSNKKTKIALAMTMLAVPILSLPGTGLAAGNAQIEVKHESQYSIVSHNDGRTIYKSAEGKFFYLDINGDMKFLAADGGFVKVEMGRLSRPTEGGIFKFRSHVSILGVDTKGRVIHKNREGEKFYLDTLGDMVFVDGSDITPLHTAKPGASTNRGAAPRPEGGNGELPGKHNHKGIVTLVRGVAPHPGGGDGKAGISDIAAAGGLTSYSTAPPSAGSDLPSASNPIPGIDIIVKKNPGGIPVVVPIDDSGKFSLRLKEPGNHTISTACRQPSGCLPHTLSGALKPGADGEPSIIAILIGLLLPAQKASADGTSYTFTVGDRGVVLSGQIPGIAIKEAGVKDPEQQGFKIAENASPRPTTRGTAPGSGGGDGKLPGLAGDPIPGVDVKLGKNPGGSIVASSRTDSQGNFHFDKLPAGNYELTLPGLPVQSLTVGADGIAGGTVMRGPDGSMSIFDRWGNRTATAPKGGGSKTAEKPVGFGSGNTMGAGPGGMGPGGGMAPPGAGPAMGGGGPAMGGPGSAMGGPGSAMRNR